MSNVLQTYLEYMALWANESDVNIAAIIEEYQLYLQLGEFDANSVINSEFDTLVDLAKDARDATVAADVMQLAADVTALTAVYAFGMSMGAFAFLESQAVILEQVASTKSQELNGKLATIDTDIASQIDENVEAWVTKYKANNVVLAAKKNSSVDGPHSRAILLRFIAAVVTAEGEIDNENFRTYAEQCAEVLKSEDEITAVYEALDKVNINGLDATDDDIATVLDKMSVFNGFRYQMTMAKAIILPMMTLSLKINNQRIKKIAKKRGVEVDELGNDMYYETMGRIDASAVFLGMMVSIIDIFIQIYDIADVCHQTRQMVKLLEGTIKTHYKEFFNGISESAVAYKAAIDAATASSTDDAP